MLVKYHIDKCPIHSDIYCGGLISGLKVVIERLIWVFGWFG